MRLCIVLALTACALGTVSAEDEWYANRLAANPGGEYFEADLPVVDEPTVDADVYFTPPGFYEGQWDWQVLPEGLIYRSYLAGGKEPRMATVATYERDLGWIWDVSLGARVGLLRFGSFDENRPEGWQLDVEGAAFPRLDLEEERDLISADFRAGVPLTYGYGPWALKFAYYHQSSHLADEFLAKNPTARRINFSRDVLQLGSSYYWTDELRLYAEAGWAFFADEGTDPWEFQFGVDFAPAHPTGFEGAPFFAAGGHLREEVNFGGNLIVQAGWAWRSAIAGRMLRAGIQYFNGKSIQFQFVGEHEEQIGAGIWYDF